VRKVVRSGSVRVRDRSRPMHLQKSEKYSSKLYECLGLIKKIYILYLIFENLIPAHIMCPVLLRRLDLPLGREVLISIV
jgi:hypothetical protein